MVIVVEPVDWARLGAANAFYAARGYQCVQVPWWVPHDIAMMTCPSESRLVKVAGHGCLVGSAEQSFLHMQTLGTLGRGRFVGCTPCFRQEPVLDQLHQLYFVKVELYCNTDVNDAGLRRVIGDAQAFLSSCLPNPDQLELESTPDGVDLCVRGVEVGSYGIRQHGTHSWIYGTGLAEPRFSGVIADNPAQGAHQ